MRYRRRHAYEPACRPCVRPTLLGRARVAPEDELETLAKTLNLGDPRDDPDGIEALGRRILRGVALCRREDVFVGAALAQRSLDGA